MATLTTRPRKKNGRFIALFCDDINCNGILMLDGGYNGPVWRCDGLTFDTMNGSLRACARVYDVPASALTE